MPPSARGQQRPVQFAPEQAACRDDSNDHHLTAHDAKPAVGSRAALAGTAAVVAAAAKRRRWRHRRRRRHLTDAEEQHNPRESSVAQPWQLHRRSAAAAAPPKLLPPTRQHACEGEPRTRPGCRTFVAQPAAAQPPGPARLTEQPGRLPARPGCRTFVAQPAAAQPPSRARVSEQPARLAPRLGRPWARRLPTRLWRRGGRRFGAAPLCAVSEGGEPPAAGELGRWRAGAGRPLHARQRVKRAL
eukprot:353640-Chlamydomonas_euryale.AAC.6